MNHATCTHTTPQAPAYTKASYKFKKRTKDYACWRQLNEKPSIYRAARLLQITAENGSQPYKLTKIVLLVAGKRKKMSAHQVCHNEGVQI